MKKISNILQKNILLLFLLLTFSGFSQNYTAVDAVVRNYPKAFARPEILADRINSDFTKDEEKARAIFTWIATHVHYDLKALSANRGERQVAFSYRDENDKAEKLRKYNLELANKTLRSQKAICEGYAALFVRLSELTGLESVVIPGTSKSHPVHIGKLPVAADHAWNAVKINGQWRFVDTTWASGAINSDTGQFVATFNDGYFFTAPELFFLNHFPDDKKWLLVNKTPQDFAELPLYYGEYLKTDATVISPYKGILNVPKATGIPIKIAHLNPDDKVAYVFSGGKKYGMLEAKRNGDISEFTIPLEGNTNGYLTIYVNQLSFVCYKVQRS